jgi:SAM-dependent methyltransferase
MRQLVRTVLKRIPGARSLAGFLRTTFRSGAPSGYVEVGAGEFGSEAVRLRGAWQANDLPMRQRELVESQLADFRRGNAIDFFDVMVKALRELPDSVKGMSLLEIGCSSGYYAEVLETAGVGVAYSGCDYSPAFIDMARRKYPGLRFDVADATGLGYGNDAFDIVVSGGCLLHIPEYAQAMAETARVAKRYAIFHRTPVVLGQSEKRYRKSAYGVEMVEIHFNEPQFLALVARNGLELVATYTLSENVKTGVGDAQRTYVCRKAARSQ